MKKFNQVFRAVMAVMLLTLCATSAEAVLKDFGPLNFGGFPSWYRDNNNVAVSQCFSHAISPVTALPICNILPNPNSIPPFDATKPITFTPNPPTNYNFPDESFYYSLSPDPTVFAFAAGKGRVVIVLALEAAFSSGNPIPGDQVVFSRVRVFLTQGVPDGNYKITHPYGVENLTVTGGLLRFTRDIGLVGPAFAGPLTGDMGPFFRWTVDPALVAAGKQNPDGTLNGLDPVNGLPNGDVFLGDFNIGHTFTGSPLGTNYFRVDGPVGSGIGGPGVDFIQSNLGLLEGWKYTTPIPTPLVIDRATYRRDATVTQLDIFASTSTQSNQATASSLQVSDPLLGAGNPPVSVPGPATFSPLVMDSNGLGKFFSHIELSARPQFIQVANTADVPPTIATLPVVDEVVVTAASYDPVAHTLNISATSSDTAAPPSLTALGYGSLTAGALSHTFPAVAPPNKIIPPETITVVSSAGGSGTANVTVLQNGATNVAPTAVNDAATVTVNVAAIINVTANDSDPNGNLAPATAAIVSAPSGPGSASATVNPDGTVNFTAAAIGSYTFGYTVSDSLGSVSNAATVTVTVNPSNNAPQAAADNVTTSEDTALDIDVLLNDSDPDNNIDLLSTLIATPPANGTATTKLVGPKRVVTYTPALNFNGQDSFTYQVSDALGASSVATVTVTVTPVNDPPIAVAETASATSGQPRIISVLANDSDIDGTINAASITITTPASNGTAVANANGTVTYASAAGFTGTASFSYTVRDNLGAASAPAAVTVSVVPGNETITVTRARYEAAKSLWTIDGTTTVFGTGVNNVMTVYRGSTIPGAFPILGTAPVTTTGTWTLRVTLPNSSSNTISVQSSGGATRLAAPVQVR